MAHMGEYRFDWDGLEDMRAKLRAAAQRYYEADRNAASKHTNGAIIGNTIRVYRGRTTNCPLLNEAGAALKELMELNRVLVQDHHLNWDFVHLEWAPILNPHPSELQRCIDNVGKAKSKRQ